MKKALFAIAMSLVLALPMVAVSTMDAAAQFGFRSDTSFWFRVNNPGWHVDLFAKPDFKGLKCRIPHGEYLKSLGTPFSAGGDSAHTSADGKFVRVYWQKRLGTMEWHWKSAHNRWCPHWNRNGWVEKRLIRPIEPPGGAWIN